MTHLIVLKFVAAHYAFVGVLGLVSYAIGYRLTRRVSYDSFLEEASICTGLGLGAIAFLIFLIGLLGGLYRSVILLVMAVCVVASYPAFIHLIKRLRATISLIGAKEMILGAAVFLWSVPLMIMPLYPPTAFDSTMYFLASAKIYVQQHQVIATPYLRLPVLTQLNEMLFVLALLFYDDIAAQLIQLLMLVTVVAAVAAFARRYFSRETSWWSTGLMLASPMVLFAGAVAYVDIAMLLFGTLAAYTFWNWFHFRQQHWLLMSGVFCGFTAGTKYPGLFFPLVFGLIAFYLAIRERKYASLFQLAVVVTVIAGPWYLHNYLATGNPVFPFFPQLFGYSSWSPEDVRHFLSVMKGIGFGRGLRAWLLLPWHLAFRQDVFYGAMPVTTLYFFALPLLAVFAVKDARIRKLVGFAFAFTVFWFYSQQELRYLLPALPMMSVATAASLDRLLSAHPLTLRWSRRWFVAALIAAAFTYGGWKFARGMWNWSGPIPATQQQRHAYLTQRLPTYPAYQLMNAMRGRDYRVYALYDVNVAYYADGTFMGDIFGPARYAPIAQNLADGRALYQELRRLEADFFLVNSLGWDVKVPQDDFFQRHFKLIYSQPSVKVFELSETEIPPELSPGNQQPAAQGK